MAGSLPPPPLRSSSNIFNNPNPAARNSSAAEQRLNELLNLKGSFSTSSLYSASESELSARGFFPEIMNRSSSTRTLDIYEDGYSPLPSEAGDSSHSRRPSDQFTGCALNVLNTSGQSDGDYDVDRPVGRGPQEQDFFVDLRTRRRSSSFRAVRVRNSLLRTPCHWSMDDLARLHQDLQKYDAELKQTEKRKFVLGVVVPNLTSEHKFSDLADFLKVADDDMQACAITALQELVIGIRKNQDRQVRDELVRVGKHCKWLMAEVGEDHPNFFPATSLFLFTLSALLSRCSPPTLKQWADLGLREKGGEDQHKTTTAAAADAAASSAAAAAADDDDVVDEDHLRPALLSVLIQDSSEGGKMDSVDKRRSYPQWRNASFTEEDRARRKAQFSRASLRHIVVCIFTLLNELRQQYWSGTALSGMTSTLADLYQEVRSRSGKERVSEEGMAVLQFYLLDGLVILLNSTFQEAAVKIGKEEKNHIHQMTDLILDIITAKSTSPSHHLLLRNVQSLLSHNSSFIRKKIRTLLFSRKRTSSQLALCSIEDKLKPLGFHADPAGSCSQSSSRDRAQKVCEWRTVQCTMGCLQAEATVYCRHYECESNADVRKCLQEHAGGQERCAMKRKHLREAGERHQRNLDMLQTLSPQSPHILQLYSYQILPEPFLVTEQVQGRRLLMHVLEHRRSNHWLPVPTLLRIVDDALDGLRFLASKGLHPRDITAYNMIVVPGSDYPQKLERTQCSILEGHFLVKIADLGLAHSYTAASHSPDLSDCPDSATEIRPVCHQGPIPVRWTSPEALFKGLYGEKSMTYSTGCLMYELFTHGCQPFSSFDLTTEDLLIKMFMLPETVVLNQWQCIPDGVFQLIRSSTHFDVSQRPTLAHFQQQVQLQRLKIHDEREPSFLQEVLAVQNKYPPLNKEQEDRFHVPETGIPASLQQLIDSAESSTLYSNTRKSMWRQSRHTEVTHQELTAVDPICITHHMTCTEVREQLDRQYVTEVLPSLKVSGLPCVTCWSDSAEHKARMTLQDQHFLHERKYAQTMSLYDAALQGVLLNRSASDLEQCLKTLTSLARAVHDCHQKEWLLRDVKASNVLVECSDGEVIFSRIGRMCQSSSSETCLYDERFEDSRRWLAPEVLVSGVFGKESDVFALATVMWEVFHIRDVAARNPLASRPDFAPCPNVTKEKVVDFVREGKSLPHSSLCPVWLRTLIDSCRRPDPSRRPSAAEVGDILEQHCCTSEPGHTPFLVDPQFRLQSQEQLEQPVHLRSLRKRKPKDDRILQKIKRKLTRRPKTRTVGSRHGLADVDMYTDNTHPSVNATICSPEVRTENALAQCSNGGSGFPDGDQQRKAKAAAVLASQDKESGIADRDSGLGSLQLGIQSGRPLKDEGCKNDTDQYAVSLDAPQFPSENMNVERVVRRRQTPQAQETEVKRPLSAHLHDGPPEETEVKRPLSAHLYDGPQLGEDYIDPHSYCQMSTDHGKKKWKWAFWKRSNKKKKDPKTKKSDCKTALHGVSAGNMETTEDCQGRCPSAHSPTVDGENFSDMEEIYQDPSVHDSLADNYTCSSVRCPSAPITFNNETYNGVEEIYEDPCDIYRHTEAKTIAADKEAATMAWFNTHSPSDCLGTALHEEHSDAEESYEYVRDVGNHNTIVNDLDDFVYDYCDPPCSLALTKSGFPSPSAYTKGFPKPPPVQDKASTFPTFPAELEGPVAISTWPRDKQPSTDKTLRKTAEQSEKDGLASPLTSCLASPLTSCRASEHEAAADSNIKPYNQTMLEELTSAIAAFGRNRNPTATLPPDAVAIASAPDEDNVYSPSKREAESDDDRWEESMSDSDRDEEDSVWSDSEFDSDWDTNMDETEAVYQNLSSFVHGLHNQHIFPASGPHSQPPASHCDLSLRDSSEGADPCQIPASPLDEWCARE